MMRRSVVLPHPEGPSRTRNSPSFAVRVIPSTAVTGPNSFLISLAVTEATSTSMRLDNRLKPPPPHRSIAGGQRRRRRSMRRRAALRLGAFGPLFVDELNLVRRPLDGFLGGCLAGGRPRHHVGDDEVVRDLVGC